MRVQPVVEGHGEEGASQLLIRRVIEERIGSYESQILRPQRRASIESLLARGGESLLRYQRVAERDSDLVLWLLDHDDGCLLESLRAAHGILMREGVRVPTAFSFIPKEYETMFLCEADCCESYYKISREKFFAGRAARDAKGHISRTLPPGSIYKPTVDQAPLTARLNLDRLGEVFPPFLHLERVLRWGIERPDRCIYPG